MPAPRGPPLAASVRCARPLAAARALFISAYAGHFRLSGQVVEDWRPALVKALGQARDLVVEVHTRPSAILVRDGDRALVKILARRRRSRPQYQPSSSLKQIVTACSINA